MVSDARSRFLPYGRQTIEDDDVAAVAAVLRGDWLTTGPAIEAFESAVGVAVGARHVVACANGTAALHLALETLDAPGSTVIVPSVTFVATANAARHAGMEVVFADVDPNSGLMTAATLEKALDRAKGRVVSAVLPVDLGGQTTDKTAIAEIALRHRITVVDDSSHAFGSRYPADGELIPVGSARHADMVAFSFHAVKNITMAEGGAVCTSNAVRAERMRRLRHHGIERDGARFTAGGIDDRGALPWYYELLEAGFNYRVTDLQCALGLSQLAKLNRFREQRNAVVRSYDAALAPLAPLVRPVTRVAGAPFWHLYAVLIDFAQTGMTRANVMRALRERGIGSQVHYIPVHTQPYYVERYGRTSLAGADAYYERTLSLPLFSSMTSDDAERVASALRDVLAA